MWSTYALTFVYFLCFHIEPAVFQATRPYFVTVHLRLKEEKVPRLIAESICDKNYELTPYFDYSRVTLDDIEDVISEKSQFTLKETLNTLNVGLEDVYYIINRSIIKQAVTITRPNIHLIYSRFLQHFMKNPMRDVPKILEILRIDGDKFGTIVVFGSDEEMLDALLQGSYTKTNLQRVVQLLRQDLTLNEVFGFIKFTRLDEAFLKLKSVSSSFDYVLNAFNHLLIPDKVLDLFNVLQLSSDDFYRNAGFKRVLEKVADVNEDLIGVAVSPKNIVTNSHSSVLVDYDVLRNFSVLVAAAVENPHISHELADFQVPLYPTAVVIPTARKLNFYTYVKFPSSIRNDNLNNCTVISVNVGRNLILSEPAVAYYDAHGYLRINKTLKTIFNIGSPLICSNNLYGVANWEFNNSTISFIPVISSNGLSYRTGYISSAVNLVTELIWWVVTKFCIVLSFFNINICSTPY